MITQSKMIGVDREKDREGETTKKHSTAYAL